MKIKIFLFSLYFVFAPNLVVAKAFDCQKGCFVLVGQAQKAKEANIKTPIKNFFSKEKETEILSICRQEKRKNICSEELIFLYPNKTDTDQDGLSDLLEKELKTNSSKDDTDQDGLSDGEEYILWGKDGSLEDLDADGKPNITDPKSYGNKYLDGENPELARHKVVVITKDAGDTPIYSFFDVKLPKKKKPKRIDIAYSWKPNHDGTIGYKLYYRAISKKSKKALLYEDYNGTGLDQGDSPIDVGAQTKVELSGMNPDIVYEFTVVAYDKTGKESDFSTVIRVKSIKRKEKKAWIKIN